MQFVCDNLRNLRETLGFSLCGLIEYAYVNILSQSTQITQRNAASCIISQRKTVRDGGEVNVVLWFWVLSAIICEICGRIGRSHIQKTMSMNIKNNNNGRSHGNKGN